MTPDAGAILDGLNAVARERARRTADPALQHAVQSVKQFQHERLAATYADLLASTRYGEAARFFLDDLYGPHDFTDRDAQFARVVPRMARIVPAGLMAAVALLAQLHALSERLDTAMGQALAGDAAIDEATYARAWCRIGRAEERRRQIEWAREIGTRLDRYAHSPTLRRTLHLMRAPARLAGLSALQGFLERGLDAFHAMHGASDFLQTIAEREAAYAHRLLASGRAGT